MEIATRMISQVSDLTILEAEIDDERIKIYVALSEPDLQAVAGIVPVEEFETGADVHATAIAEPDEALDKIDEVLDNMNPGDIAVFLCADETAYGATLELFNCDVGA